MKTKHPFLYNDLEIPKSKIDAVDAIRIWLSFQPHLPKLSDEMIMLFLHSCYYSIERTKDTIENYHTLRAKCAEFFSNWDFDDLKEMWKVGEMAALPKETPKGYRIILYRLKNLDPSKLLFNDLVKCFCAFNDVKISEDGLVPGYIVVLDMKGISFSHFMKVTPYVQSIRYILLYLQECHPVRLKQVHIINTVSFMDKVLSLIKPFIQSDLMSILHLHGNAESLSEYFPLDLLPAEYGGKQISISKLHDDYQTLMEERYKPFLRECEKFIANEKCRTGKPRKDITNSELEGSFRKLDID